MSAEQPQPQAQSGLNCIYEAAGKTHVRRTLRRRIRRMIYLSNFINLLIFGCVMLAIVIMIFKPVTEVASHYIAASIASDINSPGFLHDQKLERLEQFSADTPEAQAWLKQMNESTKLDYFLPFTDWGRAFGSGPGGNGSVTVKLNEQGKEISTSQEDMIYVRIELNGRTVFENVDSRAMDDSGALRLVRAFYETDSSRPLLNAQGETVGTVRVGIAPSVILFMMALTTFFLLAMFAVMLLVSLLLGSLLSIPILKPLVHLNGSIRSIAAGRYDELAGNRLTLKRPLREIQELADSTNLIMQKMNSYTAQLQEQKHVLEDQNEELEAQNTELQESKAAIQAAQLEIERKEASLRNLLNNAGQGFLTFGADLRIDPVYSLECVNLFGPELQGQSFPELLADGDGEHRRFLENILVKILQERDRGKREVYLPLLTGEVKRGGRHIQLEYKIIPDPSRAGTEIFMAVLTDITEKRRLESQMETERNTLKTVVRIVVNYADFAASVRDFRRFLDYELDQIVHRSEPVKDKLAVLFRLLHTYKGTFAQWGLQRLPAQLHEAESLLSRLGKETADPADAEPAALLAALRGLGLPQALDDELAWLKATIGGDFMSDRDLLLIDKSRLIDIEKKMLGLLSPADSKLLLPELRKLRYKPFKDLLRTYPDYVAGLAERMDKYIHPFEPTGEDFLADTDRYGDLGRALVHLFRNAVDHGVEPAEERSAAGKEEYANLLCRVEKQGDDIHLLIADDGRGIDAEAIRRRAVSAGILSAEEAAAMADEDIIQLVFRDELSTREQVTELSGRGIGLSSVKSEVEALGGTIRVASEPGRGTVFHLVLPSEELAGLTPLALPEIMEPLADTAGEFLSGQLEMQVGRDGPLTRLSGKTDKLRLKKVTTFISVKGAVEGMFVLTADDGLSRALLQRMVWGGVPPEEEEDFLEDSLAEAANIILGNSLRQFQSSESYVMMDPPFTIHTEGASIKYADSEIWTCGLVSPAGSAGVGFVLLKKSQFTN